jgi:hypothetical protein
MYYFTISMELRSGKIIQNPNSIYNDKYYITKIKKHLAIFETKNTKLDKIKYSNEIFQVINLWFLYTLHTEKNPRCTPKFIGSVHDKIIEIKSTHYDNTQKNSFEKLLTLLDKILLIIPMVREKVLKRYII